MSTVVVQRVFPEPVDFGDIQAIEDRASWCFEAYGVRFLKTYFSRDRRRMICVYEAPDAEAVRRAQTTGGVPYERAWAAEVVRHTSEESPELVVVERVFEARLAAADLRERLADRSECLALWESRPLVSYLSLDGLRGVCVYAAPDAESVRQAQRRVELPYEEAWPATLHTL